MRPTNDSMHALMLNELAQREQRPDSIIEVEYPYHHYSPRRYADVVRFGHDRLTIFEAKTQVPDIGDTLRRLRDAGDILPLYERTYKYRTFDTISVRLVLLATVENAELVIDNLALFTGFFGDGRTPGADGVRYGLGVLDPLDGQTCPVKTLPIGDVSAGRLATVLTRLARYESKKDFERAVRTRRRC